MKLTCLVDNAVKPSSPYWGEHGLSFLIEVGDQRILFDTGSTGTVLLHNLVVERILPRDISALALSHGHYDHTGGLAALLPLCPGLPVHAHPGVLCERFARDGEKLRAIGLPMDANLLREQAHLHLSREPQEIISGVWTTGEIKVRTEPEGRGEGHVIREGATWIPDPYEDDMALVLQGAEGLVLLCGCCHAGLLNTLDHIHASYGEHPRAIIGGTHLVAANEQHIRHVAERLQQAGSATLYPNHCTGQSAYVTLATVMGSRVSPCPAGTILTMS